MRSCSADGTDHPRAARGSSIADNQRVDEPRGTVRAFDVRTGALRWDWDPIPGRADDPAAVTWGEGWQQAAETEFQAAK